MALRTIHVGVGARGAWPVAVMGADPKFQPVALVDLNRDFLTSAQAQLGLPDAALFGDVDSALRAVDADAVVICTPTVTHAPFARLAFLIPERTDSSRVVLKDGGEVKLENSVDVGRDNAGLLVFESGQAKPVYIEWRDVERVDFEER